MKIEEYTRELTGRGYIVSGNAAYGKDNFVNYDRYAPISMLLSSGSLYHSVTDRRPFYDNLEDIIDIAKPTTPDSNEFTDDFEENYAEIMRGNRPDWQLWEVSISIGSILLEFGHPGSDNVAFLDISGAQRLWLTFRTSRTKLGFDPVYNVQIKHDGKKHLLTKIEEELGYVYREIEFKVRDAGKEYGVFNKSRQYINVVEYTAI